jgi:hypothetical protein
MYESRITRRTPGCLIFVVDESLSMMDGLAGTPRPKADAVATALNRFFQELISNCEKGEDKPYHYFDVGAIGYTTDQTGAPVVRSLFGGPLAGRDLASVVELNDAPLGSETRKQKQKKYRDDGAGGLVTEEVEVDITLPVWYRLPPKDKMFGTPMCAALRKCHDVAAGWCQAHPDSFPPIVVHLTDGEATDGEPKDDAEKVRSLATGDGNLLLFNGHLSDKTADPVLFPTNEGQLPDEYGRTLFQMSSLLPDKVRGQAEVKGIVAPAGSRCMAFNADGVTLLQLLNVGTVITDQKNLR